MRKRNKVLIITAASVLLLGGTAAVAGPMIYRDYIVEPAAETPELSADDSALAPATDASDTALDPANFAGEWSVGTGSYAGYRVNEVLNGTDVTVTGRTDQVTGTLTAEGQSITQAEFTVDIASIATDSSQRDNYFRNMMNVGSNPTATFTLTSPLTIDTVPASGEVTDQTLSGNLTLGGVTKAVTVTVQLRVVAAAEGETSGTVEVAGQIPITFTDFGMEAPNLGFVSVESSGAVEFSLALQQS